MTAAPAPRVTRKPTGRPAWPIMLLAGAEKAGKSYSAAKAAASPLVGRTYWLTFGEDQPDEYGQLADFDIVPHDGSYRDFVEALRWVVAQPAPEQGVPLLIVDSMTRLWDLLSAQAQESANARAKGRKTGDDYAVGVDLWNAARKRWDRVMDGLRAFRGPVVLTARLDQVAVIGPGGTPTGERVSKVKAHSSLPYDVGGIIELPQRGEAWLTGLRSVRLELPERLHLPEDWSIDGVWHRMGLHEQPVDRGRDHARPVIDATLDAFEDGPAQQPQQRQTRPAQQREQQPATQAAEQRPTPTPEPSEPPVYDQAEADEWAAQIANVTEVGDTASPGEIERDTLAGVYLRAERAGVLRHLVDDPTRVERPITISAYIAQQRRTLERVAA